MKQQQRPKNKAEACFYDLMIERGWELTKRGWPDFFCWKDNKFVLVEVKRKHSHRLKYRQRHVMQSLADYGVECYRFSAKDKSFTRIYGQRIPI